MKYEYMKEYEVNGKRPEGLADDVLVQWKPLDADADSRWLPCLLNNSITVGDLCWVGQNCGPVGKFRIVDERFKPEVNHPKFPEMDLSEAKLSLNNWHERGELPPVGQVVEARTQKEGDWCNWKTIEICGYHDEFTWFRCASSYFHGRSSEIQFRPIRTERDKLVERAERDMESRTSLIASTPQIEALIDAGWRPTKEQGE